MNEIETFWRVLKRTLAGYQMVRPENVWRYLAEVELRYAYRRSATSNFDHLVSHIPDFSGDAAAQIESRFDRVMNRAGFAGGSNS